MTRSFPSWVGARAATVLPNDVPYMRDEPSDVRAAERATEDIVSGPLADRDTVPA
jgi:hypothetical protein